jgi:hypothetical protein
MSYYFLTYLAFFKYFFPVVHEASSSWLKFVYAFQNHPVFIMAGVDQASYLRVFPQIHYFLQYVENLPKIPL